MKSKEEIEQLAEIHANREMEVYKSMDLPKGTKQAIFTHCLVSYNIAYTQCQEDMDDKIKEAVNLLNKLVENTELFFGYDVANKNSNIRNAKSLINSLNKQD
jgi:hypothetical protein